MAQSNREILFRWAARATASCLGIRTPTYDRIE